MFCPRERTSRITSRCHRYYWCTASTPELLRQQNSSSSSSSRTHYARVGVAVRTACRSNPCTLCTRTYTYVLVFFMLFPASHLESRDNIFSRRKIYNMACPTRASRNNSRCHHYCCCTTSTAELLQQQIAATAVAVGHTRPGLASLYARLVPSSPLYTVLGAVVCVS